MQISDLVNQYNNNLATGGEISTKAQGVEQLVSTVQKLTAGQVFEGTVNYIKGNTVVLGLSSGQNLTATIARDILLEPGQSVFFQVKSNDGQTIQIKPVSNSAMNNPTLLKALDSANLSVNERNVNMVNNMMHEQLPIDSVSLNNMAKVVSSNPNINVSTIVQMTKLGIEVNSNMASQFENYKVNEASFLTTFDNLTDSITKMLLNEDITANEATALNKEIIDVLTNTNNYSNEEVINSNLNEVSKISESAVDENGNILFLEKNSDGKNLNIANENVVINDNINISESAKESVVENLDDFVNQVNMENDDEILSNELLEKNTTKNEVNNDSLNEVNYNKTQFSKNSIGGALDSSKYSELNNILKSTDFYAKNPEYVDLNGDLKLEVDVLKFMKNLSEYMSLNKLPVEFQKNLFGLDAYRDLLHNLTEQQWLLEPSDVCDKDKIKFLYEKLEMNMKQLEDAIKNVTKLENQVTKATSEIKSNIEFMNQVNQMYSYVQIPVRMSRQNANSELFVYKNKRVKSDDEEISAFLHFDMDHLGSTDIVVKLINRKVDTKFYMEDSESYELIMNNVDILRKRIEDKGFECNVNVVNESKKMNLVEDFLRHDDKGVSTPVSRYSFDVRA